MKKRLLLVGKIHLKEKHFLSSAFEVNCVRYIEDLPNIPDISTYDGILTDVSGMPSNLLITVEGIFKKLLKTKIFFIDDNPVYERMRCAIQLNVRDYYKAPLSEADVSKIIDSIYHKGRKANIEENLKEMLVPLLNSYFSKNKSALNIALQKINEYSRFMSSYNSYLDFYAELAFICYSEFTADCSWLYKYIPHTFLTFRYYKNCKSIPDIIMTFSTVINNTFDTMADLDTYPHYNEIGKLCEYILLHPDDKFTLDDAARMCLLNKSYFSHKFKTVTGIAFIDYITIVKIYRARHLLANHSMMVLEVADLLGFYNVEYFSKKFKEIIHVSPSAFKNKTYA